jgi:hypothetical protein
MMDAYCKENLIQTPIGLKFCVMKISKSGAKNIVRMINGFNKNQFLAIFDSEDVDFQLIIDNKLCARGIRFTLCINNQNYPFHIRPGVLSAMETLESNGRKFHFKSQNTDEGQLIVAATADKHGISYSDAAINCSKITFHIDVEKLIEKLPQELINNFEDLRISGQKINVCAQTLAGKTVNIEIGTHNRVVDLKRSIAQKEGTSINQTLIFNSKQLEDNKFLRDYNIVDNCVLYVIYNPGFDRTSSHDNSDNRISNNCQQNGSPFTHYRHYSENGSHSIDHLIHNNSTAMGFRNTDMNVKSDSIPFSHWKSHTHDWNLEPKCLSSSSFSSRNPKRTAFFQNNNGNCESYTTSLGGQNESNVFSGERGVICYGDQSKQMFTEYDGFEQDYSLLINSFTIEMRVGSKYTPI